MMPVAHSGAQKAITEALQPNLPSTISLETEEHESIWLAARNHSLTPYLHQRWIESGIIEQLPPAYAERFAHARSQNRERNRRLLRELQELCALLQKRGIPVLVVKGLPLAQAYYGDLSLRVLYDLDLLIRLEDRRGALEALQSFGYVQFFSAPRGKEDQSLLWRPKDFAWGPDRVFDPEQPTFVELHTRLWEPHWHGFRLECKLDCWRDHRLQEMAGVELQVPSEESMLVHLAVHYAFNVVESNARLMHLLDIALLLRHSGRRLDWDGILRDIEESRIGPFCFLTLDLSRKICGSEIPEKIWCALRDLTPRRIVNWLRSHGVEATHSMNMYRREFSLIYFLHWAMASGLVEKSQVLLYALEDPWREGEGLERWRSAARRIAQRLRHLGRKRTR